MRFWDKFHGDFQTPYVAHEMSLQQNPLRVLRENVMLVVRDYNRIIDALSTEERRLFFEHLRRLDRKIAPGLTSLSWGEKHIQDWFIKGCRASCQSLFDIVLQFKANNERINQNCQRIAKCLLVDIEKGKIYEVPIFKENQRLHEERVKKELTRAHQAIMDTVKSSHEFFHDQPKEIQRVWLKYVKATDQKIEEALRATAKASLQELSRAINGEAKNDPHALFKVNLMLDEVKRKVEFNPTNMELALMVKQMSRQSITTIQVVPRLADVLGKKQDDNVQFEGVDGAAPPEEQAAEDQRPPSQSFYDVISNDDDILKILVSIMHGTTNVSVDLGKIISHYDRYAPIWNTDKEAFIRRYANTKRPLASFDMDITRYKNHQQDIQAEDPAHTVSFIRIDCNALKGSLVQHCVQWQQKLTTLLHRNATSELYALHDYIDNHTSSLEKPPTDLVQLSGGIGLVTTLKQETEDTKGRFDPIEDTYKCLDKFDVHVSDEEKEKLESLRPKWEEFVTTLSKGEAMLHSKKLDMRRELDQNIVSYGTHVVDTRTDFQEHGPFRCPGPGEGEPDVNQALELIAEYRQKISDNKAKAVAMKSGMDLFDIEQPEYKETADTEKELDQLEKVWKTVEAWQDKWEQWKASPFSEVVVKDLGTEAETFLKDLMKMPRSVKAWSAHRNFGNIINRFKSNLPLINDLRSPAMRPRHWTQLQEEIQQTFDPNSADFTLEKVTSLGLHMHAEAIANLAGVAQRELNIENNLAEIKVVWADQLLDIMDYKKYQKIRGVEDVNDNLEAHQLALGTMKNSPYYTTFAKDVNYWMRTLNDMVETLEMLMQVQLAWMYLESIFMDSADIRKQLPEESIMFEGVNDMWIDLMNKLVVDGKATSLLMTGLLDKLNRMNETLEKINKSLDDYLEKKRMNFPRFYFLSNDDLLEILGNAKDPNQVQKHIRKFFANIKAMELVAPQKSGNKYYEVIGLKAADGEEIKLTNSVEVKGDVEGWLSDVENAMFETLQKLLYHAITHIQKNCIAKKASLEAWVKSTPGSLLITSGQIGWTVQCGNALQDPAKAKKGLRRLRGVWGEYLSKLSKYVRGDIPKLDRRKLVALITIEVHSRDVVDKLRVAAKSGVNANSFEWMQQLRFYFEKTSGAFGVAVVRQTNTQHYYGYEYQGNNGRLVVTPLTDRCYMTLTTALHLCRGGSPMGPAGTGKTETVKDLGKNLGKFVVVFNCSPVDGVDSLGKKLAGLSQTGAWGCFDEFNRIIVEVLSVLALQVMSILNAVEAKAKTFILDGKRMSLNPTVGLFVTMNPAGAGYTGRSKVPDNLSSLFRPVSMMVPDSTAIAEIMMMSEGFMTAAVLAKKLTTLLSLMDQQLSKQDHYAGGLRAIRAILMRAASIYRDPSNDMTEELILMRALKDMNHSKLIAEDALLFDALMGDLFPNAELPVAVYGDFKDEIENQCRLAGLQVHPYVTHKIIQLFENMACRHCNMLVGGTCGGKSTAWKILQKTMTKMNAVDPELYPVIEVSVMNPKAVSTDELFGQYNLQTKEWTDGILASMMRKACMSETETTKWIMLDGPVDTLWIESMNTVMDDNKVLTLVNGDRISLPPNVAMLYEVQDLSTASPATVSRAGMIYCDVAKLGWRPMFDSWVEAKHQKLEELKAAEAATGPPRGKKKKGPVFTTQSIAFLSKLADKYIVPVLHFREFDPEAKDLIPAGEFCVARGFTRLFDAVCTHDNGVDPTDEASYMRTIEMWFAFGVMWSLGGPLTAEARVKFDLTFRDLEAQFPPLLSIFDYYIDPAKKEWAVWEDKVNQAWRPAPGTPFFKILVPTVDTVRHRFLIKALLGNRVPLLIVGNTGTGKTSIIQSHLDTSAESTVALTMNFSAATSSLNVQEMIESRLEKRQRNNFGPVGNRANLVLFIDDMNMPKKEEYGAQPPLELLKQWYDYGFWFNREKQSLKNIIDLQLVAAMGPPGGARSSVTPCFQSRFNVINFPFPNESQVKNIFRSLISNHLSTFDEVVKPLSVPITNATVELYKQVAEDFLPTPACSHYLFNMRDISKVFQGILQSKARYYDSTDSMIRLWVHETLRVFHDRLINQADKQKFIDMMNSKLQSLFDTSWAKLFDKGVDAPLFADFLEDEAALVGGDDDEDDDGSLPYQELTLKRDQVKDFLMEKLELYCLTPDAVKADLVLFDSAIDHICRIYRVIVQNRGSAMLVGVGGSGRQSLTRLAAFVADYKVKQIVASKSYRSTDFHEDLKEVYRATGVEQEQTVFLFTDMQIVHESFMEDINSILNSGEITKLFPPDELAPILDELREPAAKLGRSTATDALYAFFIERVRENLHIVLAMSPVGADFRNRCRMYPALVNNTTIDWFEQWPAEALLQVASKFLADIDLGGMNEQIAEAFKQFHVLAGTNCDLMLAQLKRYNYVTSTKYLDLVKGYISILSEKRAAILVNSDKLRNGLDKLDDSSKKVEIMSVELEAKTKIVSAKKISCETLLVEIIQKQHAADEQKNSVEISAAKTAIEAAECQVTKTNALADLEKATPALQKAMAALEKLNKNSITEIKSFSKPPDAVMKVMSAVMTIFEKEATWAAAKKELSNPNFLQNLKNFDKDNISNSVLKAIGKYTKQKDFNGDDVGKVSTAAAAMCDWVCAMELYAKVFRDVEPKRRMLQRAEAKLQKKTDELAKSEAELKEVIEKVQLLQKGYEDSENEKMTLINEAAALEDKLDRAGKLVEGLGGERGRWETSIEAYNIDLKHLVGDVAVSSAFVSYAGPFVSKYRVDMTAQWIGVLKRGGVPITPKYSFTSFLANQTDVLDWNIQGLPSDDFSIENGVLVERGLRWPLMVDPQGQSNNWIKAKEEAKLKVMDFQTPNYMRIIESAISYGHPVLIQDVSDYLDTSLDPILRLNLADPPPKSIIVSEKELSYSADFRLYITSNQPNPHYKPEITAATTLINFAVVQKGLEDQMLGIVFKFEEPKLENDKIILVKTVAAGKRKIKELEDEILSLLKNSEGDLLEDKHLMSTLAVSKVTSVEVKEKLRVSQETEEKIDATREGYRPCAVRASLCYFVLNDLAMVDPMYQFSLKSYIDLFKSSIVGSKDEKLDEQDLSDRIRSLNNFHTEATYKYTCIALFEKHKLLFAFQLCINKMKSENKVDLQEYDFFLRGGQIMDRSQVPANPCEEWLSDVAWDNITELDKLPNFKGLADSFNADGSAWNAWYQSDEPPPEKLNTPGDWQTKRSDFQAMMVLNCLRPDRVVFAARGFISSNLGPQFIESPAFNLHNIYLSSTCLTPLCFVLSAGVDPTVQLVALAKQVGQQLSPLALGQGQTPIAMQLLDDGMKNGNWVFLANCHLNLSWLPDLAKIVEKMALVKPAPHPNFRLWLSSDPHPQFPISLLQASVKMTTEPPKGLKANLQRLYANITEETFNMCQRPEKYKKLLFALTFYHAVLIERKKFLSLGWNIPYDFNDSDFLVCENILQIYLDEYEDTPWDAIKYLIAQANYGGRCTDDQDRKLLNAYMGQYFCESALTVPKFQLSSSDKYYIPEDGNKEHYMKYIQTLPNSDADPPEAFGQHPNADIASQMTETKTLLGTVLSLQPRLVPAEGAKTPDDIVLEMVKKLSDQIAQPFDLKGIKLKYQHEITKPLVVVLVQEIERYNVLLQIVKESLRNLALGIKGLMVISEELEEMFDSLFNGTVPPRWNNTFKSIKALGPWTLDLQQRTGQLKTWADEGPPKVFWLSGFTFPTGFLTALLQTSARKNSVAIDTLGWDFLVMSHDESSVNIQPKEGAYIKGLFLEGARWDLDAGCLSEPKPMELFCPMPIIHFKPVESRKKSGKGLHACPAYAYPVRTGSRENPSFMIEVDLKSGPRDSAFWTKRGTALLLSLDH